ncbi:hypothetical protein ACIPY0_07370 [Paenarthrobacter nicotinovorans]|uniref:hypothetical protein n=1 Tax=Paenarthrobacter nicotinovorans TaxID=29320 RepID=UPI00277EDCFD|nr:hypothetical protein [Paenarthrobacter nicotinovorans]MDP9937236.1 hypothetical protein [Paenarthrobacter nicotinovorans]
MSVSERLQQAADRFLGGDESVRAAQALEGVLFDEYPGDDRTEELLYVLSLYSPGNGAPYSEASDVRPLVLSTLECLAQER